MSDARLQHKVEETKAIAGQLGVDLVEAPLLVTFEMPLWRVGLATREISELARHPGTAVAVTAAEPLPELRKAIASSPNLHGIAEQGLVLGLSGGATVHVYPDSETEREAFAVALMAGVAPTDMRIALGAHVSSGRQLVTFDETTVPQTLTGRELLYALRSAGATAAAAQDDGAVVIDDIPKELEAARAALAGLLADQAVRVKRMPSGRFLFTPDAPQRRLTQEQRAATHVLAQEIAISSDRFIEVRGGNAFGFVTESVARWEYGTESGARALADELFGRPDTVLTHLGMHPFSAEGTFFFAYEGSETVWEAANKGISYVPVRDIAEYGRILHAIRKGES